MKHKCNFVEYFVFLYFHFVICSFINILILFSFLFLFFLFVFFLFSFCCVLVILLVFLLVFVFLFVFVFCFCFTLNCLSFYCILLLFLWSCESSILFGWKKSQWELSTGSDKGFLVLSIGLIVYSQSIDSSSVSGRSICIDLLAWTFLRRRTLLVWLGETSKKMRSSSGDWMLNFRFLVDLVDVVDVVDVVNFVDLFISMACNRRYMVKSSVVLFIIIIVLLYCIFWVWCVQKSKIEIMRMMLRFLNNSPSKYGSVLTNRRCFKLVWHGTVHLK